MDQLGQGLDLVLTQLDGCRGVVIGVVLLDSHVKAVLSLDRQLGQVELVTALDVSPAHFGRDLDEDFLHARVRNVVKKVPFVISC